MPTPLSASTPMQMLARMSERSQSPDEPVAVATLEMKAEQRPCGALISADGRRRSFSGWLEFAVVIQDWRAASHEGAARSRKEGAGGSAS